MHSCGPLTRLIVVTDKPERPVAKPSVTNVDSTSLCLSWYGPSYDGGTNVTDYRVETCNVEDRNWRTLTSTCKVGSSNVKARLKFIKVRSLGCCEVK